MDESGLIGYARVGTGNTQAVTAPTDGAVRVFEFISNNTASVVNFYAGTTSASGIVMNLDANRQEYISYGGLRFIGGVYAMANTAFTVANAPIITYHLEF